MAKENHIELRQIVDGAVKHVHELQILKHPTSHWDDLLIYILSSKLDSITIRDWQSSLTGSALSTFKDFTEFISHRCQIFEATSRPNHVPARNIVTRSQLTVKCQSCIATVKVQCNYCQGDHLIYHCKEFLAFPVSQRISEIRKRKICLSCLRTTSHVSSKCPLDSCKTCKARHNTLLHPTANAAEPLDRDLHEGEASSTTTSVAASVTHASISAGAKCVILSTALVHVYDKRGVRRPGRVLLDCGSQVNFVSKRFLDVLGLTPHPLDISISGINNTATNSSQTVQIKLQSRLNSYSPTIECLVTDHVTTKLPAFTIKRDI